MAKQLVVRIKELEEENRALKEKRQPVSMQLFHSITYIGDDDDHDDDDDDSAVFLGEPAWDIGPGGVVRLKAQDHIADPMGYIRRRSNVGFIVFRYYSPLYRHPEFERGLSGEGTLPAPQYYDEAIQLTSSELIEVLDRFLNRQPGFRKFFPEYRSGGRMSAPYLWWYHCRTPDCFTKLPEREAYLMGVLTDYINKAYEPVYDRADALFSRNKVSFESMPFLVRPGDVLVSKTAKRIHAFQSESWTHQTTSGSPYMTIDPAQLGSGSKRRLWAWKVNVWSYGYDGAFYRKRSGISIEFSAETPDEEIDMSTLTYVPLRFAGDEGRQRLAQRGAKFWSCRHHRLVSYEGSVADGSTSVRRSIYARLGGPQLWGAR